MLRRSTRCRAPGSHPWTHTSATQPQRCPHTAARRCLLSSRSPHLPHLALHNAPCSSNATATPPSRAARRPYAAARRLHAALTPPSRSCTQLLPGSTRPPPPSSPHFALQHAPTPPHCRPRAALMPLHAALTLPSTSCTQPSRRPRATHPQAHPAAAHDFLGWALALEGQGGDGVEGLVGLGWRVKQHSIGKSCQGEKWGSGG